MTKALFIICFFTFVIHITESLAYSMRLSGLRVRQIAIAMSFVTSTLLISRLSNMFQAPLLGSLVDFSVQNSASLHILKTQFRVIIVFCFLGSLSGAMLTPYAVFLFQKAIKRFLSHGSVPRVIGSAFYWRNLIKIVRAFRLPSIQSLRSISLKGIPRGFLVLNVVVTSIYSIGVLCSLLAGAYIPELRATAIQLSGIVNGIATILLTIFVDPSGARITDQAYNGHRPENDVRSVIFFLLLGRLVGTLLIAQILFMPFTQYIIWFTRLIASNIAG